MALGEADAVAACEGRGLDAVDGTVPAEREAGCVYSVLLEPHADSRPMSSRIPMRRTMAGTESPFTARPKRQGMAWPPLARQIWPVQNFAASETRYRMR